eukprot:TRINITY_DN107925_c0_g1_i1.p1 TRINITY_DN107925_c0_g1~~TRINITY_DN107925_c0_g1_i1.p1  ORF type:complete len:271 (-),score=53.80 TRINITY_DN107925_c0_g1_i1:24-836(-)
MLLSFVVQLPLLVAGSKVLSSPCVEKFEPERVSHPNKFFTCWKPANKSRLQECLGGLPGERNRSRPIFFMVGDSHSRNMVPAVEAGSGIKGYGVALQHPSLEQSLDGILKEVEKRLLPGDLLVSTEFWSEGPLEGAEADMWHRDAASFSKSINKMYDVTQKTGSHLLLIADVPALPDWPLRCRLRRMSCDIDLPSQTEQRKPFKEAMLAMKDRPGVSIFTGSETALSNLYVPAHADVQAFIDRNHLSYSGSLALAKPLCEFLHESKLLPK